MKKEYRGEKYIYLLMAYKMCMLNGGRVSIGKDNGVTGGQNYFRRFTVTEYKDKTILTEYKSSKNFAEFSRAYRVSGTKPTISEYITESGENASKTWVH